MQLSETVDLLGIIRGEAIIPRQAPALERGLRGPALLAGSRRAIDDDFQRTPQRRKIPAEMPEPVKIAASTAST